MGEVVPFEDTPTTEGPALCFECGHKWHAVSPVGVRDFECPNCHTFKGLREGPCRPVDDDIWECGCGGQLFYMLKSGDLMCQICGVMQRFE
jgi:hypothetical protein